MKQQYCNLTHETLNTSSRESDRTMWFGHNVNSVSNTDELIDKFRTTVEQNDVDWRLALCELMAQWPLASEVVHGRSFQYLIAGEAFDWRLLAQRIFQDVQDEIPEDQRDQCVYGWKPNVGLSEEQFRRSLGTYKYRAHLNFVYGVFVERALVVSMENEVCKQWAGNGYTATQTDYDQVYTRLYGETYEGLWHEYLKDHPGVLDAETQLPSGVSNYSSSLSNVDEFTYWLFKRRIKKSDPARVASDTRKGLEQFEQIKRSHIRRVNDE